MCCRSVDLRLGILALITLRINNMEGSSKNRQILVLILNLMILNILQGCICLIKTTVKTVVL